MMMVFLQYLKHVLMHGCSMNHLLVDLNSYSYFPQLNGSSDFPVQALAPLEYHQPLELYIIVVDLQILQITT